MRDYAPAETLHHPQAAQIARRAISVSVASDVVDARVAQVHTVAVSMNALARLISVTRRDEPDAQGQPRAVRLCLRHLKVHASAFELAFDFLDPALGRESGHAGRVAEQPVPLGHQVDEAVRRLSGA